MNNIDNKILENYIEKIANKDILALEMLYNETRTLVYNYALSITKNCSDAEDIMQDTYVNINKHADKYDPRNKPLAWILKITKNLSLNKIKSKKIKETVDLNDVENTIKNKENDAFNKLLIKNIIELLEDEERQIFILNTIDNFKFREIANLMNLKLSTVLSKYHRAVKKIRLIYKDGEQ